MSSLSTLQLLQTTAHYYQQGRETFSRHEIVKKINEIKYLSAQRKVPRITLRKEIIHLENRLQGIFELESSLLKHKKQESAKLAVFKKQISSLRQQLAASEDKDMSKKVDKLSQLLGEYTAQKGTEKDVARAANTVISRQQESHQQDDTADRVQQLRNKLLLLKQDLERKELSGGSYPELEQKIKLLEDKLRKYSPAAGLMISDNGGHDGSAVEVVVEKTGGKHTLLFGDVTESISAVTQQEELEWEKELPLPPPLKKKN